MKIARFYIFDGNQHCLMYATRRWVCNLDVVLGKEEKNVNWNAPNTRSDLSTVRSVYASIKSNKWVNRYINRIDCSGNFLLLVRKIHHD